MALFDVCDPVRDGVDLHALLSESRCRPRTDVTQRANGKKKGGGGASTSSEVESPVPAWLLGMGVVAPGPPLLVSPVLPATTPITHHNDRPPHSLPQAARGSPVTVPMFWRQMSCHMPPRLEQGELPQLGPAVSNSTATGELPTHRRRRPPTDDGLLDQRVRAGLSDGSLRATERRLLRESTDEFERLMLERPDYGTSLMPGRRQPSPEKAQQRQALWRHHQRALSTPVAAIERTLASGGPDAVRHLLATNWKKRSAGIASPPSPPTAPSVPPATATTTTSAAAETLPPRGPPVGHAPTTAALVALEEARDTQRRMAASRAGMSDELGAAMDEGRQRAELEARRDGQARIAGGGSRNRAKALMQATWAFSTAAHRTDSGDGEKSVCKSSLRRHSATSDAVVIEEPAAHQASQTYDAVAAPNTTLNDCAAALALCRFAVMDPMDSGGVHVRVAWQWARQAWRVRLDEAVAKAIAHQQAGVVTPAGWIKLQFPQTPMAYIEQRAAIVQRQLRDAATSTAVKLERARCRRAPSPLSSPLGPLLVSMSMATDATSFELSEAAAAPAGRLTTPHRRTVAGTGTPATPPHPSLRLGHRPLLATHSAAALGAGVPLPPPAPKATKHFELRVAAPSDAYPGSEGRTILRDPRHWLFCEGAVSPSRRTGTPSASNVDDADGAPRLTANCEGPSAAAVVAGAAHLFELYRPVGERHSDAVAAASMACVGVTRVAFLRHVRHAVDGRAEAEDLFASLDIDGDGVLSFEEFLPFAIAAQIPSSQPAASGGVAPSGGVVAASSTHGSKDDHSKSGGLSPLTGGGGVRSLLPLAASSPHRSAAIAHGHPSVCAAAAASDSDAATSQPAGWWRCLLPGRALGVVAVS